jgi:hypothetical protein
MSSPTTKDQPIKGFNTQQTGAINGWIENALNVERKEAEERLDNKMNEFTLQISNRFDNLYDKINILLAEKQDVKTDPPDPSDRSMHSTGGSITTISNNDTQGGSISSSNYNPTHHNNTVTFPNLSDTNTLSSDSKSILQQPVVTNNSNNNSNNTITHHDNTVYDKPRPPIDGHQKFPSRVEILPFADISPEVYNLWAMKILLSVKALTKYEGIIDKKPSDSWRIFQLRNDKYSPDKLEYHYLDAHRAAWSFLRRAIDPILGMRFDDKIRENAMTDNLTEGLEFTRTDNTFYEDSNALWTMIRDHYMVKTPFRLESILRELASIRYNGTTDPKHFISKYQSLHSKGKLLCPIFPSYDDEVRAVDILSKMPNSSAFNHMRSTFYNQEGPISKLTVQNIENYLKDWWIHENGPHSTSDMKNRVRPTPVSEEGQRRGRSRERYNTRSFSSSMSNERVVSANPTFASNPHDRSRSQSRDRRDQSHPRSQSRERSRSQGHHSSNEEEEGKQIYSVPTLISYDEDDNGDKSQSFTGSAVEGNENYIPNVNELLLDSGSAAMITPRVELLSDVGAIPRVTINTISGKSSANSEGSMRVGRMIFNHMKVVKSAPFTILSVGQICSSDELVVVCTNKASYIVPKKGVNESELIKMAIMSFPKKGNLYVKTPSTYVPDSEKTFVKVVPISKHQPRKLSMTTPVKGKPTLQSIKAATATAKGNTIAPISKDSVPPLSTNAVTTRRQHSRSGSPHPRRDVQFHDSPPDDIISEQMDNSENYPFTISNDGSSSDSDEY